MKKFWEVITRFNYLMRSAIEGPNCVEICKGDCCSIKIDVPKVLAEEYIKKGFAQENDFIRSDVFSFKLRFDEKKAKCFLFDKEINGCRVHNSQIKPPQCWIYPISPLSHPNKNEVSCKRANGWRIVDPEKIKEAEGLLQYYIFLCQLEAKKEIKKLKERLSKSKLEKKLKAALKNSAPSHISGFKDMWDHITILPAEGMSLQLKKLCTEHNKNCNKYLDCTAICDKISDAILNLLQQNLCNYVKKRGPDVNGEYPFIKLFNFIKQKVK